MRDWLKNLDEIDKDCVLQWEYLLGRKLKNREEYALIDGMIDEMVLDWDSRKEFFKEYPQLKKYKETIVEF